MCVNNYFHYFKFSFASVQNLLFLLFHNLRCFIFCFWKVSTHASYRLHCGKDARVRSYSGPNVENPNTDHLCICLSFDMSLEIWITWCGYGTVILPLTVVLGYIELYKNFQNFRDLLKIIFCWVQTLLFFFFFGWGGGGRAFYLCFFTFDSNLSRS